MNIKRISYSISLRWSHYYTSDLILALFVFAIAVLIAFHALARDDGQWSDAPATNRTWFQNLMQPDNPSISCCGEADAYEADIFTQDKEGRYIAIITHEGSPRQGQQITIPNHKIKWDKGNPTGHGIVFMGTTGEVYCYVTPSGG